MSPRAASRKKTTRPAAKKRKSAPAARRPARASSPQKKTPRVTRAPRREAAAPAQAVCVQEQPRYEAHPRPPFSFPQGYGDNRIVVLVRDPWWLYAYWEVRRDKEEEVARMIESSGDSAAKSILRVYDVTNVDFDGSNAHSSFDIELQGLASNWYLNVNAPARSWIVDIGIVTKGGRFYVLARSNCVTTPRFGMSDQLDEEWMTSDDEYWRLFGLSGGFGVGKGSLEVREMFRRRLEEQVTSGGVSSGASFYRKPAERQFWLVVDCELIVYGATEPDARVTVQGREISLRRDGTFTLRFALPNGVQHIPVEATSNDGIDVRRITPIVTRKTE